MNEALQYAGWLASIVAGLTAGGWIMSKAWRGWRKVGHFIDDMAGEPARPGVAKRPSLIERIAAIEAEVKPNGGGSMRDAVNRIEGRLGALEKRVP